MAGVSVGGGGHGGKKSVDSEIPLVPFIDLLLCCIMFLLATAVWNRLARLNANQQVPGQANPDAEPPPPSIQLYLRVKSDGFVLQDSSGGEGVTIAKNGENYDLESLRQRLDERHTNDPNRRDIIVAPEDGVQYATVIEAMDQAVGAGFPTVSLSDGAAL